MDKQLEHSCPSTEHSWASRGESINFHSTAWYSESFSQYHVKSVCRTVAIKCCPYVSQLPVKELYRVHLMRTIEKTEKEMVYLDRKITGTPVQGWVGALVKKVNILMVGTILQILTVAFVLIRKKDEPNQMWICLYLTVLIKSNSC